jgi:glycosyltransferase involved in cell wall biosynthesis
MKTLKISHNSKVVTFIGGVNEEKGIKNFITCSIYLSSLYPNLCFLIIGSGKLLEWAKREVNNLNISSRFNFTGFVENVKPYMGVTDVLVFPTNHPEGISMTLLECLSMGIVVVASDIGGNKELIINKTTGYLYKRSNETELMKAVINALKENRLNNSIRVNARRMIQEKFNITVQAKKFYSLFLSL